MSTDVLLSSLEDGVATLTLNRPDAMNAFTPELLEALVAGLKEVGEQARVIVLQGAGRCFSAGVDLKVLQKATLDAGRVGGVFDGPAAEAAAVVRAAPVPVIARVHGACFTGALEIALHCDLLFTAADAKFGDTHAKFGLRPTWGMSQTLSRAVGLKKAKELSFTARTFSGVEAASWGLANAAFPSIDLLDAAVSDTARRIAENSEGAISAYKDLFRLAAENRPLEEALSEEVAREYPQITDTNERLARFGK